MKFTVTFGERELQAALRRFFLHLHGGMVLVCLVGLAAPLYLFTSTSMRTASSTALFGLLIIPAVALLMLGMLVRDFRRITDMRALKNAGHVATFTIGPEQVSCQIGAQSFQVTRSQLNLFAWRNFWFFYRTAEVERERLPLPLDASKLSGDAKNQVLEQIANGDGRLIR